ncbi:hypothetical protein BHE74_00030028, partial [Ensete ventricosum]
MPDGNARTLYEVQKDQAGVAGLSFDCYNLSLKKSAYFWPGDNEVKTLRQLHNEEDDEQRFQEDLKKAVRESLEEEGEEEEDEEKGDPGVRHYSSDPNPLLVRVFFARVIRRSRVISSPRTGRRNEA